MSNQNKYLEKIALTRVVKELAKGTLGEFGSAKAADSVYKLMQAGAIRSPKVYQKGLRVGNQEIAKKTGQLINRPKEGDFRLGNGHYNVPYDINGKVTPVSIIPPIKDRIDEDISSVAPGFTAAHTIHPKASDQLNRSLAKMNYETGVRHELIEGDYASKKVHTRISELGKGKIYKGSLDRGIPIKDARKIVSMRTNIPEDAASIRKSWTIGSGRYSPAATVHAETGLHHSLGVLGREAEEFRKNPYQSTLDFGTAGARRTETGESDLLAKITGKYPVSNKYTRRDIRKLELAKPDSIRTDDWGTRVKEFHTTTTPFKA